MFSNPISVDFLLLYIAYTVQLGLRLETPHYLKQLLPPDKTIDKALENTIN